MTIPTTPPGNALAPTEIVLPAGVDSQPAIQQPEKKTLRVLHLINGEHYAGAERVQDLLAARLPEFGFEVGFACLKPEEFPRRRRYQDAPLYEAPMRSRFDLRSVKSLTEIVRREGYVLAHAHTPRTALVGRCLARRAGVPLIYHVHSPTSRDSTRPLRNWVNARIERFSVRGATKLITVSESLARHMEKEGFPREAMCVVPNGVPVPQTRRSPARPAGDWTLGTMALFRPRKGLEVLLRALAILRGQGLPTRLRAVGAFETPEYETSVRALVARLNLDDYIHWTGFTTQINDELARMDLFVLPSLFGEGMPMVTLEAMAAGVPIVASEVEGVPEAIRQEQEGLLVRPGDAEALAAAVTRFVRGDVDWHQIRENALRRHSERFSDRSMAAAIAAAYDAVLAPVRASSASI